MFEDDTLFTGCIIFESYDDGFPAYHAYVNGVQLYVYHPRAFGRDAPSLFGSGEVATPVAQVFSVN